MRIIYYYSIILVYDCLTQNPDVVSLTMPEVLKVQELVEWDKCGSRPDMTNKLGLNQLVLYENLRY